jgi:hypothetical protein
MARSVGSKKPKERAAGAMAFAEVEPFAGRLVDVS